MHPNQVPPVYRPTAKLSKAGCHHAQVSDIGPRIGVIAAAVIAFSTPMLAASPAKADWDHRGWGGWHGGWHRGYYAGGPRFYGPGYYGPRIVVAGPPVYYAPPVGPVWIRPHWNGPYVPGHWN